MLRLIPIIIFAALAAHLVGDLGARTAAAVQQGLDSRGR